MVDIIDVKIKEPDDVCKFLKSKFRYLKREHIYVIGLQDKVVKLAEDISFNNKRNNADFKIDKMYEKLSKLKCDSFIFSHNHPNDYPLPSSVDIKLTKDMIKRGKVQDARLIEHFVYSKLSIWPILKYSLRMEVKL